VGTGTLTPELTVVAHCMYSCCCTCLFELAIAGFVTLGKRKYLQLSPKWFLDSPAGQLLVYCAIARSRAMLGLRTQQEGTPKHGWWLLQLKASLRFVTV
jgi:hypothetical protein